MSDTKTPGPLAIQLATKAWTMPKTSNKTMDETLCMEFALILDDVLSKPWLGNATTGQLLDELKTRVVINGTVNYKTAE